MKDTDWLLLCCVDLLECRAAYSDLTVSSLVCAVRLSYSSARSAIVILSCVTYSVVESQAQNRAVFILTQGF